MTFSKAIRKARKGRKAQGMTEYIIIVALIAIAAIGVVTLFGNNLRRIFGTANDALAGEQDELFEVHGFDGLHLMAQLGFVEHGACGAAVARNPAIEAAAVAEVGEIERGVELDRPPEMPPRDRLRALRHRLQKIGRRRGEQRRQRFFVRRFRAERALHIGGGELQVEPRLGS